MKTVIPFEMTPQDEQGRETSLYLTQHVADGTYGEHKFDICNLIPGPGFILSIGGRQFKTDMTGVIERLVAEALSTIKNAEADK